MDNNENIVPPIIISHDYPLQIAKHVEDVEHIKNIHAPGTKLIRGGFNGYSVLFGNYPLNERPIGKILPQIEESFQRKVILNLQSYQSAAEYPQMFPGNISENPQRKSSHYRMPLKSKKGNEMFLLQVVPLKMVFYSPNKWSDLEARIQNTHELISELGMLDSENYVLPFSVICSSSSNSKEVELIEDSKAWNIIRNYCKLFNITTSVIPPDLKKYN
jgi:hypothetical protein